MHRQPVLQYSTVSTIAPNVGDGQLGIDALAVEIFSANVMTSTLPVRSPLPNSVPSTRSAPAKDGELGRGDTRAAIVMRMHRKERTGPGQ